MVGPAGAFAPAGLRHRPGRGGKARAEAAQVASDEFAVYFRELIAIRRARPAEDLLSEMIAAEDDGEKLTEDELIATCVLLLVAGHETTVGLISNAHPRPAPASRTSSPRCGLTRAWLPARSRRRCGTTRRCR